jgi:hypothetical protein
VEHRVEDWEARLAEQIKTAARIPFDARTWNCAKFAHSCAEAISGREIPFVWKGSLEASADAALPRIPPRLAQRGDVVLASVPEPTLGVCLGRTSAFVGKGGLMELPTVRYATVAWSV